MIPPVQFEPALLPSPNYGGDRARTLGVVVHSTRGGQPTGVEELATCQWFLQPRSQTSAHGLVGRSGHWWQFVPSPWIAWHARELNETHLGLEFEQGTESDTYTDAQYVIGAYIVREWAERYQFPIDRATIVGHDGTEPGRRDGKTDPGPRFDWGRFIGLCHDVRLALPEQFRPYASAQYGDLLDAANSLLGVARFADARNRAGLALLDQARAALARQT